MTTNPPPAGPDNPTWLTVPEAARIVGSGRDVIRNLIKNKKLAAFRVGRRYRILLADVEALLRASVA
jgi:excisionase family DNA binding protein